MSRFTLKVDEETIAAMSERQLRMFRAVDYPVTEDPSFHRGFSGVGGPTHHLTTPPALAKTYLLVA